MLESSKRTGAFEVEGTTSAATVACVKPLKAEWTDLPTRKSYMTGLEAANAGNLIARLGGQGHTPPGEEAQHRDITEHSRFDTP